MKGVCSIRVIGIMKSDYIHSASKEHKVYTQLEM